MMISPEGFISQFKDSSYKELLVVRKKLIRSIRYFKKHKDDYTEVCINPSPEVVYQCNLRYLSKLCDLIVEKYNQDVMHINI